MIEHLKNLLALLILFSAGYVLLAILP